MEVRILLNGTPHPTLTVMTSIQEDLFVIFSQQSFSHQEKEEQNLENMIGKSGEEDWAWHTVLAELGRPY